MAIRGNDWRDFSLEAAISKHYELAWGSEEGKQNFTLTTALTYHRNGNDCSMVVIVFPLRLKLAERHFQAINIVCKEGPWGERICKLGLFFTLLKFPKSVEMLACIKKDTKNTHFHKPYGTFWRTKRSLTVGITLIERRIGRKALESNHAYHDEV